MKYDNQKRIFLVKKYYELQSFALVQRVYRPKYKNETTQSNNTIFNMVSIQKAASAAGVSPTLVFSILHDDLYLKPYKCHHWHKLEAHDYEKRVNSANWFLSLPMDTKYFFICSGEAYFYLTLPINKQNNRNWPNQLFFNDHSTKS